MSPPAVIAILGPTCCWKSEVALRLAETFGGAILSCDSMQIYRGLDIGTAKATRDERARVRHFLIDDLDIEQPYDANRFVNAAQAILDTLAAAHQHAYIAGGTGLYARALIYGFSMLPADTALFHRLDDLSREPGGRERLLGELTRAAEARHETVPDECRLNPRRLVRSVEVLRLTGQLPWRLKSRNDAPDPRFRQFCIVPDLNMVKERIRRRTALMLANGWLEEAEQAEKRGLMQTPTARQALGYADIIDYLHHGLPGGLPALQDLLANKTIQYARRQLTWFKHQHPGAIMLVPPSADHASDWIFNQIIQTF